MLQNYIAIGYSPNFEEKDTIPSSMIKSEEKKQDTFKNWLFGKNPQFLSYLHKTW